MMPHKESNPPHVLLCGPIPSPTGGVSTHIARLRDILIRNGHQVSICDESPNIKDSTYNIRSLHPFYYFSLIKNSDVVHIHSSVDLFRFIHLISAFVFGKPIILTLHSWRKGEIATKIWAYIFNHLCAKVVCVNEEIEKQLSLKPDLSVVFPAFIPPTHLLKPLPENIESFIATARRTGKRVACTNAFRALTHKGVDLYGIDICLEAFADTRISSSCILICVISDPSVNQKQVESYRQYIVNNSLQNTILLHLNAIEFCSLLKLSDISIRATNTDGDALSIRESIYYGIPCVASDCTERPKNTILFKNRSIESLIKEVNQTLRTAPIDTENSEDSSLVKFYERLYLLNT